jgi:hypothetical protein
VGRNKVKEDERSRGAGLVVDAMESNGLEWSAEVK